MEIQLVHIKENFGNSIESALSKNSNDSNVFAILSVLVTLQKSDNSMLQGVFESVTSVKAENETFYVSDMKLMNLTDLLPRNTHGFYRYNGSLTFPNCTENVIWTIFKVN